MVRVQSLRMPHKRGIGGGAACLVGVLGGSKNARLSIVVTCTTLSPMLEFGLFLHWPRSCPKTCF